MKSLTTEDFWNHYYRLPKQIREQARKAHERFMENPSHPGLNFEQVDEQSDIWSARVNIQYRVLGMRDRANDSITWFWIGTHNEYNKYL